MGIESTTCALVPWKAKAEMPTAGERVQPRWEGPVLRGMCGEQLPAPGMAAPGLCLSVCFRHHIDWTVWWGRKTGKQSSGMASRGLCLLFSCRVILPDGWVRALMLALCFDPNFRLNSDQMS